MSHSHKTQTMAFPVEELNIEELKFWLQIFQEHALFIKSGLPCGETTLLDESQTYYEEFGDLLARAERVSGGKKFLELVSDSQAILQDFYAFNRRLLQLKLTCQLEGTNFPLFLDHLAREAEYALRLFARIQGGQSVYSDIGIAGESAFWLRIMADHAKFIRQLLDPSERNLIDTASGFSWEFDDLFLQGRDFLSMLAPNQVVPSFTRFLQDVRAAMVRLRDFKKAALGMIEECRLLGVIPALMADHVLREADHFLVLLTLMEKGLVKQCAEGRVETTTPMNSFFKKPAQQVEQANCDVGIMVGAAVNYDDADEDDEESEEEEAPCKITEVTEIDEEEDGKEAKKGKYQWSNKWPKPLGKQR